MKEQVNDIGTSTIRCCDCMHAKQFREVAPSTGRYILKVKCTKGHWLHGRKNGVADLYRVMTRRTPKCADYVSMSEDESDRRQSLEDLASSLPLERIIYEPDGTPVDITEEES